MTAFDELAIATAVGTFFMAWLVWGIFARRGGSLDAQLPPMRPEKKPGGAERTVIFSVYLTRHA